jgi:hypothetical protein
MDGDFKKMIGTANQAADTSINAPKLIEEGDISLTYAQ